MRDSLCSSARYSYVTLFFSICFFSANFFILPRPIVAQDDVYQRIKQLETQSTRAQEAHDTELAIRYLNQIIALDPNSFFAHSQLADNYFVLRDLDRAKTHASRALYLNQSDIAIQILIARISISEGDVIRAARTLDMLMSSHPYNTRLRLAQAELAIATYDYEEAIRLYQAVLIRDRSNSSALLGLALLYEEQDDFAAAEEFLKRAREQEPQRLATYYLSAQHYQRRGQYDQAQRYIDVALQIAPTDEQTQLLATEIARSRGDFEQAQTAIERLIENNNRKAYYWYLYAAILSEQERYLEAIESYQRTLLLQSDYELARFAAERIARNYLPEDDVRRVALAEYRFDRARALQDRSLLTEAALEVRRGLQVAPFSIDGRILFADIELLNGFDAKYVRELELAQSFGDESQLISDQIETITDLIQQAPAAQWEVDQFTVDKERVRVGVLMNRSLSRVDTDITLQIVGAYLVNVLRFSERIDIHAEPLITNSTTPLQIDEDIQDYDYVLNVFLREIGNSVQFVVEIFSPQSRTNIVTYRTTFVGSQRYARSLRALAMQINDSLPLLGQVIARQQDRVLVNVGKVQSVAVGDVFVLVEQGSLQTVDTALAFRYPQENEVGMLSITATDDLVSEGEIMRTGLFDTVSIGSELFSVSRALPQPSAIPTVPSPLYNYLLQIR